MSDNHSVESLTTILDSLDALVYVADLETHDLLYLNAYGRRLFGAADGRKCWQTLQTAQTEPCDFCTNSCLADTQGNPNGVYVWEFQNTLTRRWYQCRDELIRWTDGRLVRLEVATDITDRKEMELQLHEATRVARELAHTDELTGLNNRRAFLAYSEQLLKRISRTGAAVSLIVFDLDFFKQINDQWGHEAGDKVLQAVAKVIHPLIRSGDVLGRIGGEEFAVTMAEACPEQALALAERLRKAIANATVAYQGHHLRCSASFGIATETGRGTQLSQLLLRADSALYRAKDDGRDKVSTAN